MAAELTEVELIPNPNVHKDGLKAYGYLMRKYGFNPTKPGPFTTVALARPQAQSPSRAGGSDRVIGGKGRLRHKLQFKNRFGRLGKVPANSISNDLEWLCPVKIGTPPKIYKLNFDTGSADLWVWSTELPKSINTSERHLFDKTKSRSFNLTTDATWKISYNDDSFASGIVGTDALNLGGLKIKKQAIQLANDLSPSFQNVPGDGLLGLAFGFINHVSPMPVATPPENLVIQRNIPVGRQLFTSYLSSYKDSNDRDHKSFFTFGFIDRKAVHGQEIHYADVDNSQGLWQFQSTSVSVGDRQILRFDNTAVADTGSTLALIDDAVCAAIYEAIPGARYEPLVQGYIFPKNTTLDQLPFVKLAVGDKEFTIQKEDLAYADVGEGYVYGGMQSRGDLSFDVLGGTFLKAVYAIFDQGHSRFGVVERLDVTQAPPSATPRSLESREEPLKPFPHRLEGRQSSDSSMGIRGLSSSPASGPFSIPLFYAAFILLSTLLSPRGSLRFVMAGLLCLCLLH